MPMAPEDGKWREPMSEHWAGWGRSSSRRMTCSRSRERLRPEVTARSFIPLHSGRYRRDRFRKGVLAHSGDASTPGMSRIAQSFLAYPWDSRNRSTGFQPSDKPSAVVQSSPSCSFHPVLSGANARTSHSQPGVPRLREGTNGSRPCSYASPESGGEPCNPRTILPLDAERRSFAFPNPKTIGRVAGEPHRTQ